MDKVEEQVSKFKAIQTEYAKKKEKIDSWYMNQLSMIKSTAPTIDNYVQIMCDTLGVSVEEIKSKSRKKHIARKRHIIAYCLFSSKKGWSYNYIGSKLGKRCHATIINSIDNVLEWKAKKLEYKHELKLLDNCRQIVKE